MWQEILIIVIGVLVFGYTGWKIMQIFTKKNTSPCAGCDVSCSIKDIRLATKENCDKKKDK